MKKISIAVLASALWMVSLTPGFALLRKDFASVEGPVMAKRESTKEITVRNSEGKQQIFIADDSQFNSAKIGDTVLILHQINTNAIGTLVVTQPRT